MAWLIADSSVRPWHPLEGGLNRDLRARVLRPPHVPPQGLGVPVCRVDPTSAATPPASS